VFEIKDLRKSAGPFFLAASKSHHGAKVSNAAIAAAGRWRAY